MKIREGVAQDRRVSVEDREMRHGRKSKSKRLNGYKRRIATDLDSDLTLAGAITPASGPEDEAAPELKRDAFMARSGVDLSPAGESVSPAGRRQSRRRGERISSRQLHRHAVGRSVTESNGGQRAIR